MNPVKTKQSQENPSFLEGFNRWFLRYQKLVPFPSVYFIHQTGSSVWLKNFCECLGTLKQGPLFQVDWHELNMSWTRRVEVGDASFRPKKPWRKPTKPSNNDHTSPSRFKIIFPLKGCFLEGGGGRKHVWDFRSEVKQQNHQRKMVRNRFEGFRCKVAYLLLETYMWPWKVPIMNVFDQLVSCGGKFQGWFPLWNAPTFGGEN